jgi:hypothetical protein
MYVCMKLIDGAYVSYHVIIMNVLENNYNKVIKITVMNNVKWQYTCPDNYFANTAPRESDKIL